MKNIFSLLGWGRIAALAAAALLLAMAFFFKFMVPGYSFTALVCLLLVALILTAAMLLHQLDEPSAPAEMPVGRNYTVTQEA